MISAFLEVVPIAVGIVVTTLPLVGIALLLIGRAVKAPYGCFVGGWFIAAYTFGIVAVMLSDLFTPGEATQPLWLLVVRLGLGIVLLVLAARSLKDWFQTDEYSEDPSWMRKFDTMKPSTLFFVGAGFAVANPKNAVLFASAAFSIDAEVVGAFPKLSILAAFVALATAGLLSPLVLNVFLGERATSIEASFKLFLARHGTKIGGIVLAILGFVIISGVWSDFSARNTGA